MFKVRKTTLWEPLIEVIDCYFSDFEHVLVGLFSCFTLINYVDIFSRRRISIKISTHIFFISNTFISNTRLKLANHQEKLSSTTFTQLNNFCYLKIIWFLHPRYHPKVIVHVQKIVQNSPCACFNKMISLITMKMKRKMKKRSHRYDINRPRPRHGHKYNIPNIKCVWMWWCLYILIST